MGKTMLTVIAKAKEAISLLVYPIVSNGKKIKIAVSNTIGKPIRAI